MPGSARRNREGHLVAPPFSISGDGSFGARQAGLGESGSKLPHSIKEIAFKEVVVGGAALPPKRKPAATEPGVRVAAGRKAGFSGRLSRYETAFFCWVERSLLISSTRRASGSGPTVMVSL